MIQLKSPRELAYQILFDFERSRSRIDILESKYLSKVEFSAQDRRFIKQLISGSIRYLLYLDWIIGQLYHGKLSKLLDKTKTLLRLALYEIIYMDSIPARATVNEYVSLTKK
ncbi:MAG: transcription antitermination factor NusB, partial [Calditrichaceae bacterium]